jgi:hypothetical protein
MATHGYPSSRNTKNIVHEWTDYASGEARGEGEENPPRFLRGAERGRSIKDKKCGFSPWLETPLGRITGG